MNYRLTEKSITVLCDDNNSSQKNKQNTLETKMELLDKYDEIRQQILDYFGYVENWCMIPIDDARKYY